jgi:hypothetical protein
MTSEWEAKLDIVSDNIGLLRCIFAIEMGLYFLTGDSIFKYLGVLAVLGSLTYFIFLRKPYWVRKQRRQQSFLWGLAIRKFQIN